MHFAKSKELFGSLHFRLTMWYTGVLLLMSIAALGAVREGVRLAMLHETDMMLVDDAREVELTVEEFYPDVEHIIHELQRKARTHKDIGLYIAMYDADGSLKWSSESTPLNVRLTADGHYYPRTLGNFRVTYRDTVRPDIPKITICIGTSLLPVQKDVAAITNILVAIGAAMLVVAPVGGYWLAGRATRPLVKIIDTTARLHPSKLDERLPLRGSNDELDRLSVTINGMLDRIATYLDEHRRFTADAAHELRSPLAAMQSMIEVGLNSDRTTAEYKELLVDTLEECTSLRDLVNRLLLLAESDADQCEVGTYTVELDRIVARSCEFFAAVAESRGVKMDCSIGGAAEVHGEPSRIRQVVTNLIDNAIKFTPAGGTVRVELTTSIALGQATLRVIDSGIGISETDLPHIFKRFYRADKSRQRGAKTGGSGLGLSICESIVRTYGGHIAAESRPGHGTTIIVRLPMMWSGRTPAAQSPLAATH
jgi:heavy metal sensor kinase